MTLPVHVLRMALHFIDPRLRRIEEAEDEQSFQHLAVPVREKINRLLEEVWIAPEVSNVTSAQFSRARGMTLQNSVASILEDNDTFFAQTIKIARHLYAVSPRSASPGLLAVFLLQENDGRGQFVSLLKIQRDTKEKLLLSHEELTQITVADIPNLLIEKIQKGAIYRHPHKTAYDLKVIDVNPGAAQYFRDRFLGCVVKKSDEEQTIKLIDEIKGYALDRHFRFHGERIPQTIAELAARDRPVTTAYVAETVRASRVIEEEFTVDDFQEYLSREGGIGLLDIPHAIFLRGKKTELRKATFTFLDQKYRGIQITAPIEKLANFYDPNGDLVTFSIQTTPEGLDVKWS